MEGATQLNRETLVDQLTAQLRQQILSGRLSTGQALPSERELCDAFGVARTTVREALHRLSASGFVERRSGQLTVVDLMRLPSHELDYATLGARLSVADVFEVRQLLEAKAVALAAKGWAKGELEPVRECLADMKRAKSAEHYHGAHSEFHLLIFGLAKNPVLTSVYESSAHLFLKLPRFWRVFGGGDSEEGVDENDRQAGRINGWKRHKAMLDAIEERDAEEAVRLSDDMLARIERTLIQRLNQQHP